MSKTNWHSIINLLAFVSLVLLAAVWLFAFIMGKVGGGTGNLGSALMIIANILAYITVAFCSFIYANYQWGKNRKAYLIIWAASFVILLLFYILSI